VLKNDTGKADNFTLSKRVVPRVFPETTSLLQEDAFSAKGLFLFGREKTGL